MKVVTQNCAGCHRRFRAPVGTEAAASGVCPQCEYQQRRAFMGNSAFASACAGYCTCDHAIERHKGGCFDCDCTAYSVNLAVA